MSASREYVSRAEFEGSQSLPLSVRYARLPARAINGRSSLRRWGTNNGVQFDPVNNNVARINLTAQGVNSFLDGTHGYLEMKIDTTGKTTNEASYMDGGIFSVIQRLRIISLGNGTILEDINNYNLLHNILFQFSTDEAKMNLHNALEGTSQSLLGSANDPSANGYFTDYQSNRRGIQFATNTAGDGKTYITPLISGLFSNTTAKALALGASSGLQLEITFCPSNDCMTGATDTHYTIKSLHYHAPVFQITGGDFSSAMVQMINAMNGISFTGSTYSSHIGSIADGAGEKTVDINDTARSLKSLISVCRVQTEVSAIGTLGLSTYEPNATTAFNYRIGDEMLPPSRITTAIDATEADPSNNSNNTANAYQNVLMALGSANNIHAQTLISNRQYNLNSFVCAVDCEKYMSETGNVSNTGIDTLSGNLNVSLEINSNPGALNRVDSFAMKEVMFYLNPDGNWSVSK